VLDNLIGGEVLFFNLVSVLLLLFKNMIVIIF
jgi:hypothetical protein